MLCHKYEICSNEAGILNSGSLDENIVKMCKDFARNSSKNPKFQTSFVPSITEARLKKARYIINANESDSELKDTKILLYHTDKQYENC